MKYPASKHILKKGAIRAIVVLAVAGTGALGVGCGGDGHLQRAVAEAEAARLAVRSLSEDSGSGSDLVRRTLLAVEAVKRAPVPETVAALWSAVDELPARTRRIAHEVGLEAQPRALAVAPACSSAAVLFDAPGVPAGQLALWLWSPDAPPVSAFVPALGAEQGTAVWISPDAATAVVRVGCQFSAFRLPGGEPGARWTADASCASSLSAGWPNGGSAEGEFWTTNGCALEVWSAASGERLGVINHPTGCKAGESSVVDPVGGWVGAVIPKADSDEDASLSLWRPVDGAAQVRLEAWASPGTRLSVRGRFLVAEGEFSRSAGSDTQARIWDLESAQLVLDESAPDWLNPHWTIDTRATRVLYRTFRPGSSLYQTTLEASFLDGEVYATERGRGFEVFMGMGFVGGDGPAYVARSSGTFSTLETPLLGATEQGVWSARAELPEWTQAWASNQDDACFLAWGQAHAVLIDARPKRWAVTLYPLDEASQRRPLLLERSPAGRWKSVVQPEDGLEIIDTATELPAQLPEGPAAIRGAAFGPLDRWVVAAFADGSVMRWSGQPETTWQPVMPSTAAGAGGRDWPMAALPNGRLLVGDKQRLLEMELKDDGAKELRAVELVRTPRRLAISPDGKAVALAYDDGRLEVRTWPEGLPLARVQWPGTTLQHLRVKPDGTLAFRMLSWRDDVGAMHDAEVVYSPERLVDLACEKLPRNLTVAEWKEAFGRARWRPTCANLGSPE